MFALLAPAGFALVVSLKKKVDAHAQFQAAQRKAKAAADMRGAAAGVLPDEDVEHWRERAKLATDRIRGLESIITARTPLRKPCGHALGAAQAWRGAAGRKQLHYR
jgi:hypothetical protein